MSFIFKGKWRFPHLQSPSLLVGRKKPQSSNLDTIYYRHYRLYGVFKVKLKVLLNQISLGEDSTHQFKVGADKRRVNSKEELRRLFQITDQFHADELPTKAGIDKLDKLRFRDFLRDAYKEPYPEDSGELIRLLQNMNLH